MGLAAYNRLREEEARKKAFKLTEKENQAVHDVETVPYKAPVKKTINTRKTAKTVSTTESVIK